MNVVSVSAAQFPAKAAENLRKLRENKPLVHNITNFVVMNFTANILLAAGASPVMAHAENEVEEMVSFARALVLNIGTLTDDWVAAMIKAGKKATSLGVPIILDPVGAGATTLRTKAAQRILAETRVSVVRGNASEILALAGGSSKSRGVDAADSVEAAEPRLDELVDLKAGFHLPVSQTGRDLFRLVRHGIPQSAATAESAPPPSSRRERAPRSRLAASRD